MPRRSAWLAAIDAAHVHPTWLCTEGLFASSPAGGRSGCLSLRHDLKVAISISRVETNADPKPYRAASLPPSKSGP